MNLTTTEITKAGLGLAVCYAIYRFVAHPAAKAAALGVAGVIVAKRLPYVSEAL